MKLYQHQEEALKQSEGKNHVAYYHDMGLGKTFTGSEKLVQLGEKVNLVVCQKSKVKDWCDHFDNNYHPTEVLSYDLTKPKHLEQFLSVSEEVSFIAVGIINYDLMWRRPELYKLHDFTLMLDESSLIQNEHSKRSDFILGMDPKNVILLSGTPTGGKYENLWSQMHLLGWNISKELFLKQYVEVEWNEDSDGNRYSAVVGYKNVDRLKRKMAEHGCQFLKTEEVIELPEQNFCKLYVPVSTEYRKFIKDKIITIDDNTLVGDTSLTKLLCERMLCGMYSADKLTAFKDLLESTNDRLLVFYNFTFELQKMMIICAGLDKPMSFVNGFEKNLTNYEQYDDSVTFVQYQSGAYGLNLQKANKIIYFTPTLSCEQWMQSLKRIHRIGQNRPCFYYQLICKNSREERIYSALANGVDYTDELFRMDEENES